VRMAEQVKYLEQVTEGLLQIEMALRQLDMWALEPPAEEAFRSSQPFFLDTMDFAQWLQFVFLERMKVLVEAGRPLPTVSGMTAMAEECFRGQYEAVGPLLQALEDMDRLLSRA